ncbi:hypothetical protein Q73_01845 [Bacillus coahuilensis m2-6]|uniref:protein adenylyltransferase SelO n=1 Tax=Bacillus coahuilensis TaxID=408580 RepID=UPI0007505707|nr:YdiU family protein [Bacillus coahuilensis]KUP09650.1 hypothetical protein Q73_01845 [Bacillus coahuilensis m2-6]
MNSNKCGWNLELSYSKLPNKFYSKQLPTPVRAPELLLLNERLASELGLDEKMLQDEEGVAILSGNEVPEGADPISQAYAGHQFAHFTMLGDGRAVLLGEQITPNSGRVDIQLKGAGRTPYSRGGDGRAAIGPMLREYIISEAMNGLGIPTTRSLAVVSTGDEILRETRLPGAVLTRVAKSHLRVGTFQYAASFGTIDDVKDLADYAINRHFPHLLNEPDRYSKFLEEVLKSQAELVAKWQLIGFVHGVMNTDNMTISGETIDYGPCAFMDKFDPGTVFSSIDVKGRYVFGNQPYIAGWNVARLAECLIPLLHKDEKEAIDMAQSILSSFPTTYHTYWKKGMRDKLGLFEEHVSDQSLFDGLLKIMHEYKLDYTNTFISLMNNNKEELVMYESDEFQTWLKNWQKRLHNQEQSQMEAYKQMQRSNPAVIPRNHRVEEALEAAAEGNYDVVKKLLEVLKNPYAHSENQKEYQKLSRDGNDDYITYCGT